MKKYSTYSKAAVKRKRDEMTIFDKDSGKYMNVKVWRERMPWEKKSLFHRWM